MTAPSVQRTPLFSVTLDDCDVQHFAAGGPGGQNQNKRHTGARVIHRASGARGESREHREQRRNTKAAFIRMAETAEFRRWIDGEVARRAGEVSAEERVDASLADPRAMRVEIREDDRWVEVPPNSPLAVRAAS